MTPIARFSVVALDCPDPVALADFYGTLTGWVIDYADDDWVQLEADEGAALAFQLAPGHQPPNWPDGPQQIHLDFDVDDLDEAEQRVLNLGGRKADYQPEPDQWRVCLDPAGHPFCLVLAGDDESDYGGGDRGDDQDGDDVDTSG